MTFSWRGCYINWKTPLISSVWGIYIYQFLWITNSNKDINLLVQYPYIITHLLNRIFYSFFNLKLPTWLHTISKEPIFIFPYSSLWKEWISIQYFGLTLFNPPHQFNTKLNWPTPLIQFNPRIRWSGKAGFLVFFLYINSWDVYGSRLQLQSYLYLYTNTSICWVFFNTILFPLIERGRI